MKSHVATESISKYLRDWINSESKFHFAVLIEGKWGSGKTYYIKEFLEEPGLTDRKIIYISMFGIASPSELQKSLLYASLSKKEKAIQQGLGVAGSIFNGAMSFGSGGILSGSVSLEKAADQINSAIFKSSEALNKSVIVIDDLERCSFDAGKLLGIMNSHVEHGNARVIIIANTEQIKTGRFQEFREKVIGQSFEVEQDAREVIKHFISDISEERERSVILNNIECLVKVYEDSDIRNLRAIRQFIWLLRGLLIKLSDENLSSSDIVEKIIKDYFIFYIEFKLNLDKRIGVLTVENMLPEAVLADPDSMYLYIHPVQNGETASPLQMVSEKYKLTYGIHSVISITQWVNILTSGIVNGNWINRDIDKYRGNASEKWPSWRRLWYWYAEDFSEEESRKFSEDIDDLLLGFSDGRYKNPLEFMHAAGVAIDLSRNRLIDIDREDLLITLKNCINNNIIPEITEEYYKAIHWGFETGYEGLGYSAKDSPEFKEIQKYIKQKAEEWREEWYKSKAWAEVRILMRNDIYEFVGDLSVINGIGKQRFTKIPILVNFPVDEFVDEWTSLLRKDENSLFNLLQDRYKFYPNLLKDEKVWWSKVRDEFVQRSRSCTVHPRAIQLMAMADGIEEVFILNIIDDEDEDR